MIINGLQAKAKDRQWLKNQTSGELDDTKLIEGTIHNNDSVVTPLCCERGGGKIPLGEKSLLLINA